MVELHDVLGGDGVGPLEEEGVSIYQVVFETYGSLRQLHILDHLAPSHIVCVSKGAPDILA